MIDDQNQDATTVDDTTADSSTGDQQTGDTTSQESQTQDQEGSADTKDVPELNRVAEKARKLEKEKEALEARLSQLEKQGSASEQSPANPQLEQVKQSIKALGFVSQDDVEAKLRQQAEDARLNQHLSELESRYNGADGRPKFQRKDVIEYALEKGIQDPEIAFKALKEKELLDWSIKQAVSGSRGVKSEASDGSGSSQAGTTNDDLKKAIGKGDSNALSTYLKRVAGFGGDK